MPEFTTNQWAVVALVFVAGWLLGLMNRSGSRWRREYDREREEHRALKREHEALLSRATIVREDPVIVDRAV